MPRKPSADLASFHKHLLKSERVLAVLGAGISASSGLPTFRGKGGIWRTHDATALATPEAFEADPGFTWQFYSYRRHMALQVQPNPAHYALAEYARRFPKFLTLTQNVDGLSQRADHPLDQLLLLHGSLFQVKCSSESCDYTAPNFTDPIVPALALPVDGSDPTTNTSAGQGVRESGDARPRELDISDENVHIPHLTKKDLPPCPKCHTNILRPGVVWFGESLPSGVIRIADKYIAHPDGVDLVLVIGTSAQVWPAAGYAFEAKNVGARICVVNMEETTAMGLDEDDWYFRGDAAVLVPELLKPLIGDIGASTS